MAELDLQGHSSQLGCSEQAIVVRHFLVTGVADGVNIVFLVAIKSEFAKSVSLSCSKALIFHCLSAQNCASRKSLSQSF